MAETQPKRLREKSHNTKHIEFDELNSNSKRQKPYNYILSLLEIEEDEEASQDFSSIFLTLQQELTFDDVVSPPCTAEEMAARHQQTLTGDEDVRSVMRHLLEASDDELGIPNVDDDDDDDNNNYNHVEINYGENLSSDYFNGNDYNCLWEFEDVTGI